MENLRRFGRQLLTKYGISPDAGSITTIWSQANGDWHLYFGIMTTRTEEYQEIRLTKDTVAVTRPTQASRFPTHLPNSDNEVSGQITEMFSDRITVNHSFNSSVRVRRRTSDEMSIFGNGGPAYTFEYWDQGEPNIGLSEGREAKIRRRLNSSLNVDIDEIPGLVGNLLLVFEDPRAKAKFNEGNGDALQRLQNNEPVSNHSLLEMYDGWCVELNGLKVNEVEITIRREEFGDRLVEEVVRTTQDNRISESEALSAAADKELNQAVKVRDEKGVHRYNAPTLKGPGASDVILRVSTDGEVIDEASMPLVREVGLNVSITGSGSKGSQTGQPQPPTLFEKPEHRIGRRPWDTVLELNRRTSTGQTWVVGEGNQDAYDEVMDVVYQNLSGTVKISEPYLLPSRLEEFLDNGSDDLDLWVVVGHTKNYMNKPDFKSCIQKARQDGKDAHVMWVPGRNGSPLHDRFILNEKGGLTIGTSFNTLDSNLTVVSEIDEEVGSKLEEEFDYWWTNPGFHQRYSVEFL